jgi:hypothetical protein
VKRLQIILVASVVVIAVSLLARAQAPNIAPTKTQSRRSSTPQLMRSTSMICVHGCGSRLRTQSLITARGEVMHGAAEVEKGLAALFEGRNKNASVKTLSITLRLIRPDVALAHVTNEISGVLDASGQTRFRRRGNSVLGFS